MDENDVLFDGDSQESSQSVQIDYSEIEKAMYNALNQIEKDKADRESLKKSVDSDVVLFSSETDAQMYTGNTADAPTSSAQQQVTYLLDIRNILIIFLFAYFLLTIYSKIKNLLMNYYTNE